MGRHKKNTDTNMEISGQIVEPTPLVEKVEKTEKSMLVGENVNIIHPCQLYRRNSCGLLDNLQYEYDEFGMVQWKKLIPREYLVPNRQFFEKRKVAIPTSIEGLKDNEMIVLLNGYQTLANFRGFKSLDHQIVSASSESVTVKTTIKWVGNYETNFLDVEYSAIATASLWNTYSFCKYYLGEIAQNRGTVRAIRNFLRIPILGADELGEVKDGDNLNAETAQSESLSPTSPHVNLQNQMNKFNISFEKLKSTCIKKQTFEGAENWNTLNDIPVKYVTEIITQLKNKEK